MHTFSSVRQIILKSIGGAQGLYKAQCDHKTEYRVGNSTLYGCAAERLVTSSLAWLARPFSPRARV